MLFLQKKKFCKTVKVLEQFTAQQSWALSLLAIHSHLWNDERISFNNENWLEAKPNLE